MDHSKFKIVFKENFRCGFRTEGHRWLWHTIWQRDGVHVMKIVCVKN